MDECPRFKLSLMRCAVLVIAAARPACASVPTTGANMRSCLALLRIISRAGGNGLILPVIFVVLDITVTPSPLPFMTIM